MEKKLAVIATVISNKDSVAKVNEVFHVYSEHVLGRLGIPHREKGVNVISVVMDAPIEIINSLSGKMGMVKGVSSKVLTAK
jgi:putative iron-only hydrogenase system regulator